MKIQFYLPLIVLAILSSCVSQQKYTELEALQQKTNDDLNSTAEKLNICGDEKTEALAQVTALTEQLKFLRASNEDLMDNMGDITTLSQKGAENLTRTLESLKERDMKIQKLSDAVNRKDSINFALVSSLKGALGTLEGDDIEINVEKGVVYISISDKLLFNSGSYKVTQKAKTVLGKVATVVNAKPDLEFLVEGHTDNVPIKLDCLESNWDLSVKRAISVINVLQNTYKVDPKRMTAAGRSYYFPVADNDTKEGRAQNRRTRIIVTPKFDQFFNLIEEGLKGGN